MHSDPSLLNKLSDIADGELDKQQAFSYLIEVLIERRLLNIRTLEHLLEFATHEQLLTCSYVLTTKRTPFANVSCEHSNICEMRRRRLTHTALNEWTFALSTNRSNVRRQIRGANRFELSRRATATCRHTFRPSSGSPRITSSHKCTRRPSDIWTAPLRCSKCHSSSNVAHFAPKSHSFELRSSSKCPSTVHFFFFFSFFLDRMKSSGGS